MNRNNFTEILAVEIEINHNCNRKCSYCPNSNSTRTEKGEMSPVLYKKVISDLKKINFKGRLSFDFYNEPLLSKNIFTFIAYANDELSKEVSIVLYTNGSLLTYEIFSKLINLGVTRIIVTKHEQENSSYVFDKTLSQLNRNERDYIVYREHEALNKVNRGGLLPRVGKSIESLTPCYLPSFLFMITLSGEVLQCFEDYHQKTSMGNVSKSTIEEIWNSEKFKKVRKDLKRGLRHKHDICKNCNRLEVFPGQHPYI